MRSRIEGLIFIALMVVCGCTTGCDRASFQKKHPVASEAIEASVDVAEEVAETAIEHKLNLPPDSINIDIDIFPDEIPH